MDDNYAELIRQKSDYKQQREDKYRVDSKDRLSKIIRKKIETTMIGALSSIEENLGFLWNHEGGEKATSEQAYMRELYQKIRSEVLDKGNNQARNVDAELSQYDIKWLKYSMNIPVVPKEEE